MKKNFSLFLLICLSAYPLNRPLWAIGVKTLTGRIHVENVPIGSTITLQNISGKVYRVVNTSEEPMEYTVTLGPPGSGDEIRDFEPLPNFEWVKLARTNFFLAPGQEALVDIIFSFPDDPLLLGKKFVCFVTSGNVPRSPGSTGMGISMRVKSKFTMIMASDRLTPEQREKAEGIRQRLDFQLTPSILNVENFPKGQGLDLKKFNKKTLKIINPNDEAFEMTMTPIAPSEALMKPKEGFVEGRPEWIQIKDRRVTIDSNIIYEIPITMDIPKSSEPKSYMFVIKVTLEGFDVPVNSYGRIYVVTK